MSTTITEFICSLGGWARTNSIWMLHFHFRCFKGLASGSPHLISNWHASELKIKIYSFLSFNT